MISLILAATSWLMVLIAPAITPHGDELRLVGAVEIPAAFSAEPMTWVTFELAIRDSLVWPGIQGTVLLFPHSAKPGLEHRITLAAGGGRLIGTLVDRRRPQCGTVTPDKDVSLPADSVASRARDDGRRAVMVYARFPGTFSADSLIRIAVGQMAK